MRRETGSEGRTRALVFGVLWGVAAAAGVAARAEISAAEPAIARTAQDPGLAWGPCPEFLPVGCRLAVLHGDPAKPDADLFLEVPAGSRLAEHWHSSAERMVLVAGELHVTYEGQPTAVLRPGTYAYGPARRRHDAVCASAVPCVLFIAFEAPVDAVPVGTAPVDADRD